MTQPAGWYDDPQDPSQLRYWDGVIWSDHVTPKISPNVAQSNIGMPHDVVAVSARQQASPDQWPPSQGPQGSGQSGGPWPAYGQAPAVYDQQQQGWSSRTSTTADGVPLASWGLRVAARLLDGLITLVLALPFTGWFYYRYIVGVMDWTKDLADQAAAGVAVVAPLPPWEVLRFAVAASLVGILISGTYEVFFLRRSGATPGKKVVGISVRMRDRPGPPPMKAVLGRTACYYGLSLISFGNLLDCLWPLWDDKKQAIHDKAVHTNVVMGRQPTPRRPTP